MLDLVDFTEYPKENITVPEGDKAQFSCAAVRNHTRVLLLWFLKTDGELHGIVSNTTFPDGTVATVGSDYRSPLTLSNITSSWNRTLVQCVVNFGELKVPPEPSVILTVHAKDTGRYYIVQQLYTIIYQLIYL